MDKQLSTFDKVKRLVVLALILVTLAFAANFLGTGTKTAQCTGNCQACYCEGTKLQDGHLICLVNGQPSACIGCVGVCTDDSPKNCQAEGGKGGCGSVIAWERHDDCRVTPAAKKSPTPATATPTPQPPIGCPVTTWTKVQPPGGSVDFEPPYPLVARQDTTNTGFTLLFDVSGGWAKKYEQKPEQLCKVRSHGETYPDDCLNSWEWVCVRRVIEQHNDPVVQIDLGMRLGDGVKEWIEEDLGSRYYGAKVQDNLPHVWQLYKGAGEMSWTDSFEYHPFDPGTHGGRLILTTKGTPLNRPQEISLNYSVPVYLWDTTYGGR